LEEGDLGPKLVKLNKGIRLTAFPYRVYQMSKTNFSFLESHDAVLARLCTLAEGYCHTDPQAALNKLRVFTEEVVTRLYSHFKFGDSSNDNLFDRLEGEDFKKTVPPSVLGKLHMLVH